MSLFHVQAERGGKPFNFLRKAWHMLGFVVPVALYADLFGRFGPHATRLYLVRALLCFLVVLVVTDLLRFRFAAFARFYTRMLGALMKAEETTQFNASIPYIFANLCLVFFCSPEAVMLSALFLNLGDAAASFFGARFGRLRFWNGRSLAGTMAFFLTSFVAGSAFLVLHTQGSAAGAFVLGSLSEPRYTPVFAVFIGSLAAAVAELLSVTGFRGLVDDNLWVPPAGLLGITLVVVGSGSPGSALFLSPSLWAL